MQAKKITPRTRSTSKKKTPTKKPDVPMSDRYSLTDKEKEKVAEFFGAQIAKDDDEVIGMLLLTLNFFTYEKDGREKEELFYLIKTRLMLYTRAYSDALSKTIHNTYRKVKVQCEG